MAIIKYEQRDATSRDRLTQFSDQFANAFALGPANDWASIVGDIVETDAPQLRFPIPVSSAGYHEFKGEVKYRSLDGKEARLRPRLWQDGVLELRDRVADASWLGFQQQPAQMAFAALHLMNSLFAALLEANSFAGAYTSIYDNLETETFSTTTLFNDAHQVNLVDSSVGTFDNNGLAGAGGFTQDNVTAWDTHFASIKGPNGKPLGLQLTHVLVPRARFVAAQNFFKSDYLLRKVTNVAGTENVGGVQEQNLYRGAVQVLVSDELTQSAVVYPMALNKPGMVPLVGMRQAAPEVNIIDESSHYFLTQRKIGVQSFLNASGGALFPQAIAKVTLS